MAVLYLRKLYDKFVPVDQQSFDLFEKFKMNGEYKCTITSARNYQFHKKAFALVNFAFEAVDFGNKTHKGIPVEKNLEQFRDDLTILAGYYTTVFNYKGEMRLKAKSWSFARMSQDEFDEMYSKLIDVILANVLTTYTRDDLDRVVQELLGFA